MFALQPPLLRWLCDADRVANADARWDRWVGKQPPLIRWYHHPGDPQGWLLAQMLVRIRERRSMDLRVHTVSMPGEDAMPRPDLWPGWALRDAKDQAVAWGLDAPRQLPDAHSTRVATAMLQATEDDAAAYLELAVELGARLYAGETLAGSKSPDVRRLAAGRAELHRWGHYGTGLLQLGLRFYQGVDRVPYLEERLNRLDGKGTTPEPDWSLLRPVTGERMEYWFSVRSPYSYIGLSRLADTVGLDNIDVRPVLPMVMRGLAVPLRKRLYLVQDAAREAHRWGVPFGRVQDPLGAGIARVLTVWALAGERGAEALLTAARGIWSEGLDVDSDADLKIVADAVEVPWAAVHAALDSEPWRARVEDNRSALEEMGLWGVPSMRVGDWTAWGQDRIEGLLKRWDR